MLLKTIQMDHHDTPSSSEPRTQSSTLAPTGQTPFVPPWFWRFPGPGAPARRGQTCRLSRGHLSDRTLRCRKSRQLQSCALLCRRGPNTFGMRKRMCCGWFALRICFLRCRIRWRRCFRRGSMSRWLSRWHTWWRCWEQRTRRGRDDLVGMDLGGWCLKCGDLAILWEAGHFSH